MSRGPAAFVTISSCLLATALTAQAPRSPAGDAARDALAGHARDLLALAEKALGDRLVNDAERLLRMAERCDAGIAGADELETKIDAALVASASSEGRDALKAFWKSPASNSCRRSSEWPRANGPT